MPTSEAALVGTLIEVWPAAWPEPFDLAIVSTAVGLVEAYVTAPLSLVPGQSVCLRRDPAGRLGADGWALAVAVRSAHRLTGTAGCRTSGHGAACQRCLTEMPSMTASALEVATSYAAKLGRQAGHNAAGWYIQDSIGGRTTGDTSDTSRRLLRGIEDGDPMVLDSFPSADLSGQWADAPSGPAIVREALEQAGLDPDDEAAMAAHFTELCDAYEMAFDEAVSDEIARAAQESLS